MKRELELKDIVGYLPWGLKAEMLDYKVDYTGKRYDFIKGLYCLGSMSWHCETQKGSRPSIKRIKPILKPMTNEVLEEVFKDYKSVCICFVGGFIKLLYEDDYAIEREEWLLFESETDHRPKWIIDLFHQHHVDYQGLIEEGLAIDELTLNK